MSQGSKSGVFTILYFAGASSFTKKTQEQLPAPLEVSRLFSMLEQRYKGITKQVLNSCLLTVNQEYVGLAPSGAQDTATAQAQEAPKVTIQEGDEVAIIPPVSSG